MKACYEDHCNIVLQWKHKEVCLRQGLAEFLPGSIRKNILQITRLVLPRALKMHIHTKIKKPH